MHRWHSNLKQHSAKTDQRHLEQNKPEHRGGNICTFKHVWLQGFSITDEYWLLHLDWEVVQMSGDGRHARNLNLSMHTYTLSHDANWWLWFSFSSKKKRNVTKWRKNERKWSKLLVVQSLVLQNNQLTASLSHSSISKSSTGTRVQNTRQFWSPIID